MKEVTVRLSAKEYNAIWSVLENLSREKSSQDDQWLYLSVLKKLENAVRSAEIPANP